MKSGTKHTHPEVNIHVMEFKDVELFFSSPYSPSPKKTPFWVLILELGDKTSCIFCVFNFQGLPIISFEHRFRIAHKHTR